MRFACVFLGPSGEESGAQAHLAHFLTSAEEAVSKQESALWTWLSRSSWPNKTAQQNSPEPVDGSGAESAVDSDLKSQANESMHGGSMPS